MISATRKQALTVHAVASLIFVSTVAIIMVSAWYPGPLMDTDGDWKGVLILWLVDVVLGPLLTYIVFKPGKPGLVFDMTVIVAIQLAGLMAGAWTLHSQRPTLLVYADDQLQSIPLSIAREFLPRDQLTAYLSEELPVRVLVDMPREPLARSEFIRSRVKQYGSLHRSYGDYVALGENWQKVLADSLDMPAYTNGMPVWQRLVSDASAALGRTPEELAFIPLVGTHESVIVIAEAGSGEFLAHLPLPYDSALRLPRSPPPHE